ncbi:MULTISPECIES: hypothetical protein [Flavobacterium]|uniref:Uncharacterized protein n=1 Tax=Flavobacterium hankyongi TaxID=1176532 RepID=A0ABP9A937_9FLAO|nr:hypothetical protein [Flavobacterium sp. N1846]
MGKVFIIKDIMKRKLKIKFSQLREILSTEEPKFPLILIMDGITDKELDELYKLLKKKKKS